MRQRAVVWALAAAGVAVWLSRRQAAPAVAAVDATLPGAQPVRIAPASLFVESAPVATAPSASDWDRLAAIDERTLTQGAAEWFARREDGRFLAPQAVQL